MYLGNKRLRKESQKVDLDQKQINEFIKCREDIIYFAENYFYIISLDKGREKIKLWDFQKRMLKALVNPPNDKRHLIFLSSRQIGKTTINTIFFTWYALFHKDKTIAILAHKEKAAMDILKRIKFAYEQLPLWMQQGIRDGGWNKKEVLLENGVTIFASSTSSNACKSYAVNLLYLDEFAFVPDSIADDFMSSVYPTIASGKTSRIIIVSCVSDDTFVFTDNGIKQVKDFVKYDEKNAYEVLDYNVFGKEKLNCGNIMVNNGYVDTKIIKTTSSELECSLNHKFWACKNGKYGWYKSSELTTDDYISIQYGMNMWGNDDDVDWQPKISNHHKNIFECKKITSDVAYFLGLFIAEGCGHLRYRNNKKFYSGITITCGDDISKILDSNKIKYYSKDCLHYEISSMSLIDFMEYLGFDLTKKANEKIIPKRLMQMSKKNMKALIQGIFDGDVYSRNDKGYIGIGLSSKELIKQIRMILLNFGILTDYQEVLTKPTKKVKVDSMQYRISCNGYFSKKFYKEIGFRFERKKLKEQFIREGKRSGACDVIPYSVDFLRKKFKHHKNIKLFSGCHKNNIHFSRKFVLENKNDLMKYGDDECINWIDDNVNENIKWEKISEIKDSKNEVFDFSLKEIKNDKWCHSIVYNGIIAHNTPNGMNHFYNIWKNAISNKNNYFPVKIKWNEVPGRDDNFKKDTIADIGLVKWNQEFACQKGNSLINIRLITEKTVKSVKILDLFDCENYK